VSIGIRSPRALAVAVVGVHAAVVLAHGAAHAALGVSMSAGANAFITLVIGIGPLVALALLLGGKKPAGAVVLGLSMVGSLVFGAWNHFVVAGPDHVAHLGTGADPWAAAFRATAVLLAVLEAGGAALGWLLFGSAKGERSTRPSR
jgi:hypothetical protein